MGVETRGRTQYGDGDGSGDGNESSCGDGNGCQGGNRDGNEDRIEEGRGEANKCKKPQRVADAMWETGETWVERETNVVKKRLVQ